MHSREAEAIAGRLVRADPATAFRAGIQLLRADHAERLLPAARRLSERHPANAQLAQLLGLAARSAGDGPLAHSAFARAARLAPADPLIAHSHARAALEAGKPATGLFERAAQLAPQDGAVLQGLAAALVADRRGGEAMERLEAILSRNPLWIDGHRSLAHIRGQYGLDPVAHLEAALASDPGQPALHRLYVLTLLEARRYPDAARAVATARDALGEHDWLTQLAGHIASELGDIAGAEREFAAAAPPSSPEELANRARHMLRAGRPAEAAALLEPRTGADPGGVAWPYLSLAWRLLGDPRSGWLEGDENLVGVYDLAGRIGDFGALADHLRDLHFAREAPLDQSVRGGTQTDGNLLLRDEAPIRELRKVLLETVADHVRRLPPPRPGHPTLIADREPRRVAGSWSVRLRDAGFHCDHVHSEGWLSSAFYVALPATLAPSGRVDPAANRGEDHAGWLSLGECRDLVPDLAPRRLIEPFPGRLVLFPSTMWHGTRPFPSGERLTVAFDIARPRQDADE